MLPAHGLLALAVLVVRPALAAEIVGFTARDGPRLAIEQTHTLRLRPSAGEKAFNSGASSAVCVLTGAGDGFAIGMPTHQPINDSDPEAGPPVDSLFFFTSDNGPSLRNEVRGGNAGLLKCGKG